MTDAESTAAAQPVNNDIDPKVVLRLPRIPKAVRFQNPRVIGYGLHSEVYSIIATYKKRTITAALKFFSARWKGRFEAEVQAYEFFEHNSLYGIVPIAFGCGRDWDHQRVREVLGNALVPTSSLQAPVSVIMLEYISESAPLSVDNINWKVCEEVLRGLDLIHLSQVLHHDIGERNVLVVPATGRVVWIDFSSSYINPSEMEKWREREVAYSILYQEVLPERLADESKDPLPPRTPTETEEDVDAAITRILGIPSGKVGSQDNVIPASTQLALNRKKYKKRVRTIPFRLDRLSGRSRSRSTNAENSPNYAPLRREAEKIRAESTTSALKLTKPYEQYGSTDGDWRLVPTRGRVVMPPGCAPRRSRRLNG